ncbi:MAG: hypothetical protein WD046_08560 [Paracoccaceae bacterium]
MRAASGLFLALAMATPALADTPVLELRVGSVAIVAAPDDLSGVEIVDSYQPGLMLQFGPDLARQIAKLTGENIGQEAQLAVCGTVLLRLVIRERIAGGSILVAPVPAEKLQAYLAALTGQMPCPPAAPDN